MLKKAMIYLGLGPDEHYENYDAARSGTSAPPAARYGGAPQQAPTPAPPDHGESLTGTTVRPIPINQAAGRDHLQQVDAAGAQIAAPAAMPLRGASVTRKPHAVSPELFNDAQEIGDRFKSGQAVIINLQAVNRDLRRRLVDFSSGLCYARDGKMDRVADEVYLLTPAEVDPAIREPARQPLR